MHRDGVQTQSMELKVATLKQMEESTKLECMSKTRIIEHVAAGMLLCCFEVSTGNLLSQMMSGDLSL